MEERFTVLKIPIPKHSPMLECLLETNSSQLQMPAIKICYGRTFILTTALILEPKYWRKIKLEPLTVGVHSSVSVLILPFTHSQGECCLLSEEMRHSVISAKLETEFLSFSFIIKMVLAATSSSRILLTIFKIISFSSISS